MATFAERMAGVATRLVAQYGVAMTLQRMTHSGIDPDTGRAMVTTTTYDIVGTPPNPVDERRINGETILAGDAEMIVDYASLTITPSVETDSVGIDGRLWKVVNVRAFHAGLNPTAYQLTLRR